MSSLAQRTIRHPIRKGQLSRPRLYAKRGVMGLERMSGALYGSAGYLTVAYFRPDTPEHEVGPHLMRDSTLLSTTL